MKKRKKIIKSILFVTLPFLIFLFIILELFFRYVIPAAEIPQSFFDEQDLIYKFDTSAKREGIYTIGKLAKQKGRWRINNFGWNSPIDYLQKHDKDLIAIYGDSYIEAFQVDTDKSYPSLLRETVKDTMDVYSFGKSGAPLSEYLNYSRYANKYFDPDILIFNVIHNDFAESITKLNPQDKHLLTLDINGFTIKENTPKPNYSFTQYNWKKRLLKRSALVRYLLLNLHIKNTIYSIFNKTDEASVNANINTSRTYQNRDLIEQSVNYILHKLKDENPNKHIIFVMDGPRMDIYNDNLSESNVLFLNKILKKYCDKYNFEIIDLTMPMLDQYKSKNQMYNSELDGHWNEYGHWFVYEIVLRHLIITNSNSIK